MSGSIVVQSAIDIGANALMIAETRMVSRRCMGFGADEMQQRKADGERPHSFRGVHGKLQSCGNSKTETQPS
jgi:hypothetical protein